MRQFQTISARALKIAAAAVVVVPLGVALVGQVLIWALPDCDPNFYAPGECLVGSYNIASVLMLATIGGIYFVAMGLLVSVLLLIGAFVLSRATP